MLRAHVGLGLAFLACGEPTERRIYVNSGSLCVRRGVSPSGVSQSGALAAGGTLRAEVKLLECLSKSCNREIASACTISERDGVIGVTSRLVIETHSSSVCATDCGIWLSRCELPEPQAGEYRLGFGRVGTPLVLPLGADVELMPDGTTHGCSPEEP